MSDGVKMGRECEAAGLNYQECFKVLTTERVVKKLFKNSDLLNFISRAKPDVSATVVLYFSKYV